MIPQSAIHIDGKTAWLVDADPNLGLYVWPDLDRPCDNREWISCTEPVCPDCDGTGRHTFEIEVDRRAPQPAGAAVMDVLIIPRRYRVSVVPGMVEEQEDGTWRVQLNIHQ